MLNFFKRITIKNFQSHHHTEIEFHEGLNVFVGSSDSGKSAILRAIRWVLFNLPRGSDFISVGSSNCEVILELSNGFTIRRSKGKKINRYTLINHSGKEQIFEAFGNKVPQEIMDVHGVKISRLDNKDMYINFGSQLEGPFLLSESAGTKAKIIGHISGSNHIDIALKKVNSEQLSLSGDIKRLEISKINIEEKLKEYNDIDLEEQKLANIEKLLVVIQHKQKLMSILKGLCVRSQNVSYEKNIIQQKITKYKDINTVSTLYANIEKIFEFKFKLSELYRKNINNNYNKNEINKRILILSGLKKISLSVGHLNEKINLLVSYKKNLNLFNDIKSQLLSFRLLENKLNKSLEIKSLSNIEKNIGFLIKLRSIQRTYQTLIDRISKGHLFKADISIQIEKLILELLSTIQKINKCPTCGSIIDEVALRKLTHELRGGNINAAAGRENYGS